MDLAEISVIPDPLDRACAADEQLWLDPAHYTETRELRRVALTAAVESGRSVDEIATRLRVRTTDVERLTRHRPVPGLRRARLLVPA